MSRVAKNPLEWAVFFIGLTAILVLVGFLVWDATTSDGSPPEIHVELGSPSPGPGGFTVPVTVRNRGDETAEGVEIEVSLELPGESPETAGIEMAFVPRRSQREGWVTLRHDPRRGRLTGRAAGYERP